TLLDIVLLRYVGMQPVLVHGGGPEITAMSERLGLKAEFKNGLRITDDKTMEVVKMVLTGKVSPDLVAAIHRLGGQAVGMSGEDGPTIIAEPLAHIVDGRTKHALLLELFTEAGIGTMVTP